MGLATLFGRHKKELGGFYHEGERIDCESCGTHLRIKYFTKGKIIIAGPDAFQGIALRCSRCGFITCADCSLKRHHGEANDCPSCEELLGPTVIVDPLPRKRVTA